ncbi:HAD-like domain-containing protein [Filobasidium floriforme]|uniref:HAD-like domain-containing protein n=1 Tax=Filobasidium floriforme TaxID=5210 RepID=UPI001E8D7C79|nr:HAD-like domain-containing protein [Filobasidium floriforme]KAH8081835.1 HAD-like domain-containing protein [Filobasidium floriforme]
MLRFNAFRAAPLLRCNARCKSTSTTAGGFPEKLAFAFDIDGVLKQGPNVLPQARRALDMLAGNNPWNRAIPYVLITNGGGVPDEDRRKALSSELGHELSADQLVQSHTPLKLLVKPYADKHVLCLGGKGDAIRRTALSYGLKNVWIAQDVVAWKQSVWPKTDLTPEDKKIVVSNDFSQTPISAIFVMHDSRDWGRDVTLICELLSSENGVFGTRRQEKKEMDSDDKNRSSVGSEGEEHMPLVFSNPDLEWQSDYPLPRLGQGAFRMSVETIYKATTGRDLPFVQYGKPHKATYDFAESMLRRHLKTLGRPNEHERLDVYMIGDNPESDIAGANAHGWNSVLLKTGVYRTGEPRHKPTSIADDVEVAVRWAVERAARG